MNKISIYHNPRCSKSREALQLLQQYGCVVQVIEYLKTPPTFPELEALLKKLHLTARDLLRTTEEAYQQLQLANLNLTDEQIIQAICQAPQLLQRPIVILDNKAIIARPVECLVNWLTETMHGQN